MPLFATNADSESKNATIVAMIITETKIQQYEHHIFHRLPILNMLNINPLNVYITSLIYGYFVSRTP